MVGRLLEGRTLERLVKQLGSQDPLAWEEKTNDGRYEESICGETFSRYWMQTTYSTRLNNFVIELVSSSDSGYSLRVTLRGKEIDNLSSYDHKEGSKIIELFEKVTRIVKDRKLRLEGEKRESDNKELRGEKSDFRKIIGA